MSFRKELALFFAVLSMAACAHPTAGNHSKKARLESAQAYYVPPGQFKTVQFTPPPGPDSDAWKTDIAVVSDWQAKRTGADCARADRTFIITFDSLWGDRNLFPQPLPADVQNFFSRLDSDIDTAARVMKDRFRRPRPDISNPCPGPNSRMKKGGGYSYPSSHAAISRVFAGVLADIAPERKSEFIAKADEIAGDRVIIGVHYPSDIAAGKDFGDLFHSELLKSETYLLDFKRIKILLMK